VETVVLSDMHLTEAEDGTRRRPLWMSYKRREYFVDADLIRLLDHIETSVEGPIELVFNGDIVDFDNVTQLPEKTENPEHRIDLLARLRGLASEEWMSLFKLERILADHADFFVRLGAFIAGGHRVVFVIGNHDVELNWPSAQRKIMDALGVSKAASMILEDADEPLPSVVFCNWFYLSGGDTYISHGHQYDPNCSQRDPINPLVLVQDRPQVCIPFGDLATRYMLNGMGYFNPHATDNFIMSILGYARFFFRYFLRTQPQLIWTWFWGAMTTLIIALRMHWRPAMRDPLLVDQKVRSIARRSRATPSIVRKLSALHEPSASARPLHLMRELWLDRGLLLLVVLYGAWQVILHINIVLPVNPLWVLVPLGFFLLPYLAYAASVRSTVFKFPLLTKQRAELISAITGVSTAVFGHTHLPGERQVGPLRYLNGGFWSAAFSEPECKVRIGTQTFVWLKPVGEGKPRRAELLEWPPGASEPRPYSAADDREERGRDG